MLEKQFFNRVTPQTNIIVQNAASSGKQRSQLLSANKAECQRLCIGPEKNVRRIKDLLTKGCYGYTVFSYGGDLSTSQCCIQDDSALVGFREESVQEDGSLGSKCIRKVNTRDRQTDNRMRREFRLQYQRLLHRWGL